MVEASNRIQKFQDKLSNSTQLITELRTNPEPSQRLAADISESASKQSDEIQL
jgi:hypothetical protein